MQIPLRIAFRNLPPSEAIDTYVRKRASKLERFSPRIVRCDVAVESPHKHQLSGRPYRVRIDLTIPGAEVVVGHSPDENRSHQDVYACIDDAFDDLGRRLEDVVRRMRGDIKPHVSAYQEGRVCKLWSYEGFGFLQNRLGEEVYFHKNSVLHHGFERLKVGDRVRFVEEMGNEGPQASTVTFLGR
jgi:ribosomal subunit interface protein